MNAKEAEKLLSKPIEENYISFSIGYSASLIMPHKQGLELVKALACAEEFKDNYNGASQVAPISPKEIHIKLVSAEEYREAKLRYYLEQGTEE